MKIYISHSIRGKHGLSATVEQMNTNCKHALDFAKWIREQFPDVKFYVPAESEPFVQIAYITEILTEEEILRIDCEIISSGSGMIVFAPDGYFSRGMQTEIDWCLSHNIPYVVVGSISCNEDNTMVKLTVKDFIERITNG